MEFNHTEQADNTSAVNEEKVKVLILGSGPAGLSAALYAARAELSPLVLTGMEFHGQAALTGSIENYPGFPEGVGGAALGDLFQKQAERFGARIEFDTASQVDFSHKPFQVKTYSKTYLADSVIITTGASSKHLNVPGENKLTGRGVSYCATCDGWFFKERKVVVVGGGDSALEEALFLTRYASSITIVHRRDAFRAGALLKKRAGENPKIEFVWNSVVAEIIGEDAVKAVRLRSVVTAEERLLPTDGVFVFIGHTPNTQLFVDILELDEGGYLKIDDRMQTNIPGIFAAGEAADSRYRQVVTSAGMGAAAAMQAIHYLESDN
jgi:thioredoxin reductase (NADPH)